MLSIRNSLYKGELILVIFFPGAIKNVNIFNFSKKVLKQ